MKPVIIYDLDGTLANTGPDLLAALNHSTKPYGLPAMQLEQLGHLVGHGAMAMIERAFVLGKRELEDGTRTECQKTFLDYYRNNIANNTALYEGALQSIDSFRAAGCNLAICTNKQEGLAQQLARELGIIDAFSAVTGGDTFSFRKPDGRHLLETVKLACGTPNNAIMVGDTITDITAAKNASIPIIAVDFGYSSEDITTLGADRIISHFDELFEAAQEFHPSLRRA